MALNLYEHQKKAVENLRPGSILCGGVGTGKSRTALAYFYIKIGRGNIPRKGGSDFRLMENPLPLYIITTARKRDTLEWEKELQPFLLSTKSGEGQIDVTVDSWNNIKKYAEVKDAFFIFDEQRLVGYGAWVKAFFKIARSNLWVLLTATPGDTWMDYMPVFVANGYYKNKTEFVREHVIYSRYAKFPKIERYVGVKKLERIRSEIVVNMDAPKRSTRHHSWIKVGYDQKTYGVVSKNRWNVFLDKPVQTASEWCYILRRIVNSDPHRSEAISNIMSNHKRAIIFYNFDYELEILRKFCDETNTVYAEWNGHKHQPLPTDKAWLYLVQYTAGAEGWNCVSADTIIFYSQNYSYKIMEQACGRIDRINSPYTDLYYYHIFSESPIDKAIRKCVRMKKVFNEHAFMNKATRE